MNKLFAWVLSMTKLGKVVDPVQKFLSGKKVYLAGAAIGVPALVSIIQGFAESGLAYLLHVSATPEFQRLMEAIAAMGLRAAVTKAADPTKDPNGPATPQ